MKKNNNYWPNPFSQLLKPRPELLAEVAASVNGGQGGPEAIQRLTALFAAAAAAANQNKVDPSEDKTAAMKVPPISLPSGLPFNPNLLWNLPNPYLPPPSPLESQLKSLPGGLGHDARQWNRDDVMVFLRYCEREFDLDKIDMEKFQMNGKALCLLSKQDLVDRCGGAGDVIHNMLQMLQRETFGIPPSSPRPPLMTPTSPAMPLSPHAWPLLSPHMASAAHAAGETFPNLSHLISQANSVTLSPAPSIESTNGSSPKVPTSAAENSITSIHQLYPPPGLASMVAASQAAQAAAQNGGHLTVPPPLNNLGRRSQSASSSHSDSEDSTELHKSPTSSTRGPRSPAITNSHQNNSNNNPITSTQNGNNGETPELNTNGRLLWDFLQQLLNDPQQRYTSYIAWKNKETGVFKIVDPAGLAKLWGIQKNHLSMNYDKMSRALRYYYRVNILRKVQGERHCYQFLRNPSELKSIKNISLLRQQMEAQAAAQKLAAQQVAQAALRGLQHEVSAGNGNASRAEATNNSVKSEEEPTDLTMDAEEKALRLRERLERERLNRPLVSDVDIRDREQHEPRHPQFDFRHLIPQVSIKSE